ncbi:Uncharacterised protein [Mycobacteroides abscessus subsp. abscessus]|nr:Uncharacterised protein [Mycobacteroides abscessus subsp. abscessus]
MRENRIARGLHVPGHRRQHPDQRCPRLGVHHQYPDTPTGIGGLAQLCPDRAQIPLIAEQETQGLPVQSPLRLLQTRWFVKIQGQQ